MGEGDKEQPQILFDFGPPPPRRVTCPIIDAHLHIGIDDSTRQMLDVARSYGVTHALGICKVDTIEPAREAFDGFLDFAVGLTYDHCDDAVQLFADNREILTRARDLGATMVKFWFKPQFTAEKGLTLDDERMRPILDLIGEMGMACVAHIADPDTWFHTHYRDTAKFGTKEQAYVQLEGALRQHRNVIIQGAHMGGDPEHLDHLRQLLDAHPNLCLDTSATKWVTRELSLRVDEARQFFLDHQDRLLFGTDLVPRKEPHPLHYASRYWTLQKLLETDFRGDSPIYDPDACGPARLNGLDLPDDVLRKIYHLNAERLLGLGSERGLGPSRGPTLGRPS